MGKSDLLYLICRLRGHAHPQRLGPLCKLDPKARLRPRLRPKVYVWRCPRCGRVTGRFNSSYIEVEY